MPLVDMPLNNMDKLNKVLMYIFLILMPPFICIAIILAAYWFWIPMDDEVGSLYLNIGALMATIFLTGYIVNLFILGPIKWIHGKIHDYRLKQYYKKHPEKEKENTEALAKDFEKMAKILRGEELDGE